MARQYSTDGAGSSLFLLSRIGRKGPLDAASANMRSETILAMISSAFWTRPRPRPGGFRMAPVRSRRSIAGSVATSIISALSLKVDDSTRGSLVLPEQRLTRLRIPEERLVIRGQVENALQC